MCEKHKTAYDSFSVLGEGFFFPTSERLKCAAASQVVQMGDKRGKKQRKGEFGRVQPPFCVKINDIIN